MNEIVSAAWLHKNLNDPDLVLLDASMASSSDGKYDRSANRTIPNSRPFDLTAVFLDTSSPFPNTIPDEQHFELECRKLGIKQTSRIIVFDSFGIYSSPRVWWLFHSMGHTNIAVLDGGLPTWLKMGLPTVRISHTKYEMGDFKSQSHEKLIVKFQEIAQNIKEQNFLVVDARSPGRFQGTAKEPRAHLKSGHIPNSVNIPYQEVLENDTFKGKKALKELFEKKCGTNQELVFSCGSGLTACIVMLASEIGFKRSKRIYDGSWTEWAELKNLKNNV